MLSCRNLTFAYTEKKTFLFPTIECAKGETLLIIGNSGSGKTTLLHLLALILQPKSGSISLNGTECASLNAREASQIRAKNIGIIYQKPHFVASLSVLDNLLIANYLADNSQNIDRATALANNLGFEDLLLKQTTQLSGGEQQRVSIARALMNNPTLILADEPTSNLDDENCHKVAELLEHQAKNIGAMLVIVTHDQRLKDRFPNQILLS